MYADEYLIWINTVLEWRIGGYAMHTTLTVSLCEPP